MKRPGPLGVDVSAVAFSTCDGPCYQATQLGVFSDGRVHEFEALHTCPDSMLVSSEHPSLVLECMRRKSAHHASLQHCRRADCASWLQVAAAAEINQAGESQALSTLAHSGFSNSSAIATAVHNCRYRPYIARQVFIGSRTHCDDVVQPARAMTSMCLSLKGLVSAVPQHVMQLLTVPLQAAEAAELARGEELLLPPDLDYSAVQLSAEDREKLGAAR